VRVNDMEVARGSVFTNARLGGGIWAKNPKPSVHHLISGVPCETAAWGDAGRWWVQVDAMVAAEGWPVCQCEAGREIWAKNPKPSIHGLVSGMLCKTAV
jgi:hypothetical protein